MEEEEGVVAAKQAALENFTKANEAMTNHVKPYLERLKKEREDLYVAQLDQFAKFLNMEQQCSNPETILRCRNNKAGPYQIRFEKPLLPEVERILWKGGWEIYEREESNAKNIYSYHFQKYFH